MATEVPVVENSEYTLIEKGSLYACLLFITCSTALKNIISYL